MRLAIFDVDGTLTATTAVDTRCFLGAVRDVVGVATPNPDWSTYADVTDSGIFAQLFSETHGRAPDMGDVRRFVRRFLALLRRAHRANPAEFREVAGAAAFLGSLEAAGWSFAIATGGFGASARQKLSFTAIDARRAAFASADDARSRERIVTLAHERALRRARVRAFERVVLVGDAAWDRRTAVALRLPFVRIAADDRSQLAALEGFADQGAALRALADASVPDDG